MFKDRLRRAVEYPGAVLTGLLVAFLAARIVICAQGKVFTSYDSFSYAYRGDPAFDRGPVVSLFGDAPRLWGVPLFYAIFPGDHARAVAQWALGTVAWALLAWALWTCLRGMAARCLAAAGVLLLGVLPQVTNWDFAILSESLSISLGVLTLALLLLWGRTGSAWALAGATAAALWWTFTRPDIRVLTIVVIAALAVIAWRRPALRRGALAGAGVLAVAVLWCTAISPIVARTYTGWSATPTVQHEEGLLLYRLRIHVLPDPEAKAIFQREFGMPSCPGMEEIAAGPAWETARFALAYGQCPEFKAWGKENAGDVWQRYALAAPDLFARQTVDVVKLSLEGSDYAKTTRVAPAVVQKVVFPPRAWVLPVLTVGLLVGLVALVASGAFRRRTGLAVTGPLLAGAAMASVLAGIWYGSGEYWRFGIQEAIGIRIAVLIMLVTALDSALTPRDQGVPQVALTTSRTP